MGKILHTKPEEDGILVTLELDIPEAVELRGNFKDVLLFSLDAPLEKTGIFATGVNRSTKYFEIPPSMVIRQNKKLKQFYAHFEPPPVYCQYLPLCGKHVFIYSLPKKPF